MDIAESIYEVVVETSHTKTTKADANRDGHIRLKRGKSALSNNYSEMSKSTEGAKKYMQTIRRIGPNPHVSSMAPVIHQMNARF